MADNYVLYGPEGSAYNLGSFILSDPGPDFGEQDLLKANYAENSAAEGGVLAFETTNIRRMQFPLRLASHSAWSGVNGLSALLRRAARPGAYIDLQPDGVASSESVRFDVAAGRLELAYEIRQYGQLDRIPATLKLDVQPFGYWPTEILVASAASVGMPGVLTLPAAAGGSLFGDVPGLARITIQPTAATNYSAATFAPDMIAWSLGGQPSFSAFYPAASLQADTGNFSATLLGHQFAPGSQAQQLLSVGADTQFKSAVIATIGQALEPAYRGRFRLYAFTHISAPTTNLASSGVRVWLAGDVVGVATAAALGSAGPVAIANSWTASLGAGPETASNAYHLSDLGEVSVPRTASGLSQNNFVRLFIQLPSQAAGTIAHVAVGGLYLQPVDAPAGVLPRGLIQPNTTFIAPTVGRLTLDAINGRGLIGQPAGDLASQVPLYPADANHRGVYPRVSPSVVRLDILGAARPINTTATGPLIRSAPHFAAVSVSYRPRFTFLKGL
jgi:hypothetical protein